MPSLLILIRFMVIFAGLVRKKISIWNTSFLICFHTFIKRIHMLRFSPYPPVSCTNKTDCHDITEILFKVALNTIKPIKINNLYYLVFFKVSADQVVMSFYLSMLSYLLRRIQAAVHNLNISTQHYSLPDE
jgi:hypothetical protein